MSLTPFTAPLRAALEAELRAWLALPDDIALQTAEYWAGGGLFEGYLVKGEQRLRFILRQGGGSAWQADGLSLTCKPRRTLAPEHKQILRALHARFSGDAPPAKAGFAGRLRDVAFFVNDAIDDDSYVTLEQGTHGLSGFLRLGYRCNQDCFICPQSRSWPDPPAALTLRWLYELAEKGLTRLMISGGEPTTYRQLPEVVARATAHGMEVMIQTNAIALASARMLDRLWDAGLRRAFVSFHSHLPDVSDAITRAPGTHVRTVAGIHAALQRGMRVALNCCVEELNVDTLPDHARYVVQHFVRPYGDAGVLHVEYNQPGAYFDRARMASSVVPLPRVGPRLVEALGVLGDAGVQVHPFGTCGFPPCVVRDRPSVAPWPVAADLDEAARRAKRFPDLCAGCAALPHCSGVRPGYTEAHGERGLAPYAAMPDVRIIQQFVD